MFGKISTIHRRFLESHRIAAPASTLMLATVLAVGLGLFTRTAFSKPSISAVSSWVSESASPGELIEVVVSGHNQIEFKAYLPGLTHTFVPLRFDESMGQHIGQITVPTTAPERGYCTLRIIGGAENEVDHSVRLQSKQSKRDDQGEG